MQTFNIGRKNTRILLVPYLRQRVDFSFKEKQITKPTVFRNEGECVRQIKKEDNRSYRR